MSDLQEKFSKMINDQQELKRKFQEEAKVLFKDITKEFFEKNPGVTGIVWTQYTPYFMDGDPCEFCVNDATFTNAPNDELDDINWGEYNGETEGVWASEAGMFNSKLDYYKEEREKVLSHGGIDPESCMFFSKTICSPEMEDVMEAMFGDHVKVIATREGFEVIDFDHD